MYIYLCLRLVPQKHAVVYRILPLTMFIIFCKLLRLYDLLDLPREVLADIVNHIEDRELKSKHQFVEAVIRTLPKLEKNHTAIALASSSVLLQRPVKLLHGDLRNLKGVEPFTSKQVGILYDIMLHVY